MKIEFTVKYFLTCDDQLTQEEVESILTEQAVSQSAVFLRGDDAIFLGHSETEIKFSESDKVENLKRSKKK